MKYTDIGHDNPNAVIWILIGLEFQRLSAGLSRTHELIWGGETDITLHWRGRFDPANGFCSIVGPVGSRAKRPPSVLVDLLISQFHPVRFYYFSDSVESFSPNPRKEE